MIEPQRFGRWKSEATKASQIASCLRNLDVGRNKRWRGRLSIGRKCHPLVRALFKIINAEKTTIGELAQRVGARERTISMWRYRRNSPNLQLLIAAFNALDYDLTPIPRRENTVDSGDKHVV